MEENTISFSQNAITIKQSKGHRSIMEAPTNTSYTKIIVLSLIAILITIIGGMLTGIVVAVVGSLFYIVFLFPLGMGFVGGNIVKLGIRLAKIRKISQVILLSVLVAISIYGTYHFVKYIIFRGQMFIQLSPRLTEVSRDDKVDAAQFLVNYALIKATGHSGFIGYMLFKAQHGISLQRFYDKDFMNLGPVLTWAYWFLELGLIFWVAMRIGKQDAQAPVCEVCGSRLGKEKHLGGTTPANELLLLDLIRSRQFVELGKLIEKNENLPSMELYMQRCEACEKGNSYVTLRLASRAPKGGVQLTDVQNVMLNPGDSVRFSQEFISG